MKIFGCSMEKNINYEQGKHLLQEYIQNTEQYIKWLKEMCDKYDNTLFDLPDFGAFDYEKAVKFIRTWEIINEFPTDKKNLFLIYCACEYNYTKTLAIFNDIGKGCKNAATLRVLISNIRKLIKEIYTERYGAY